MLVNRFSALAVLNSSGSHFRFARQTETELVYDEIHSSYLPCLAGTEDPENDTGVIEFFAIQYGAMRAKCA